MRRFGLLTVLALALYAASAAPALTERPAPAPERVRRLPLVDRAIEHHGGAAYRASATRLMLRSRSGAFRIVARVEGERFDYTVSGPVEIEPLRRVRLTNETLREWRGDREVVLDAAGLRAARNFVQALVYFPFLPYKLNDPGVWKEDQGIESWSGRRLRRVKVGFDPATSDGADDRYVFWFDPDSAELVQYAYTYGAGENRGIRLRRLFNLRRIGGILFADAHNSGLDGRADLDVDALDPALAAAFRPVSTVRLEAVEVRPLRPSAPERPSGPA